MLLRTLLKFEKGKVSRAFLDAIDLNDLAKELLGMSDPFGTRSLRRLRDGSLCIQISKGRIEHGEELEPIPVPQGAPD